MSADLTPGQAAAVIDSLQRDLAHVRAELAGARRELSTYRPDPDPTAAPRVPGHVWTSQAGWWEGPCHLTPATAVPYPGRPDLPLITVPGTRTLCGTRHTFPVNLWPMATNVCPDCAERARTLEDS